MVLRDMAGNTLEENDTVSIGLGFGQTVAGKIAKMSSGLGLTASQQPAMIYIAIMLDVAAQPNGVIPGVFKVAQPPTAAVVQ